MNDIVNISNEIQSKIKILVDCRSKLKEKGEIKSKTIADYDKSIALVIMGLKNGKEYKLDNGLEFEFIINPPVTIIDKIAKGLCYKEKLAMEVAESDYKSLLTFIDCVQAELNGFQSINRYLSEG